MCSSWPFLAIARRPAALLGAMLLALVLGACGISVGGNGGEADSGSGVESYAAEAEGPLAATEQPVSGLGQVTETSSYDDDEAAFVAAEEALTEFVAALEPLEPPAELATQHQSVTETAGELASQLSTAAGSAAESTTDRYPEGYPEQIEAQTAFEQARSELQSALGGAPAPE